MIGIAEFKEVARGMQARFPGEDAENCVAEAWAELALKGKDVNKSFLYNAGFRRCAASARRPEVNGKYQDYITCVLQPGDDHIEPWRKHRARYQRRRRHGKKG